MWISGLISGLRVVRLHLGVSTCWMCVGRWGLNVGRRMWVEEPCLWLVLDVGMYL